MSRTLEGATAADRVIARAAADRARELAAFVRARPASLMDRGDGEVGAASAASRATRPRVLTAVSEWAVDEVAVALRMTGATAQKLLTDSLCSSTSCPRPWRCLEEGLISWDHARVAHRAARARVRRQACRGRGAGALAGGEGKMRCSCVSPRRRAVAPCLDAKAGMKRLIAPQRSRERHVAVYPGEERHGGSLPPWPPTPVARACLDALERYADACAVDGDGPDEGATHGRLSGRPDPAPRREAGSRRCRFCSPWWPPPRRCSGATSPARSMGALVPAPMVRELAYELGLLPDRHVALTPRGSAVMSWPILHCKPTRLQKFTDADGDVQAVADSRSDAGADVQADAGSDPDADPRSDIDHESDIHHESDICGSADGDPGGGRRGAAAGAREVARPAEHCREHARPPSPHRGRRPIARHAGCTHGCSRRCPRRRAPATAGLAGLPAARGPRQVRPTA